MTETPLPPGRGGTTGDGFDEDGNTLRIRPIDLRGEIEASYLEYAMSVIVGRALPEVRDGLKPVHRRMLYAMYDGGYRPDRRFNKCARVVGEVMGQYHPHGDGAIYDTLVRLAQPWVMRYPLVDSQGNFGSPGNDPAAAMRYTECRMAPLAMEMVRDINRDTVDFEPNYDGQTTQPVILPARFPNLLVNGSSGIAVGMATNIPPHNLREVADGVQWSLAHPEASRSELLEALLERIKGPDFPQGALIVGTQGIEEAYRTGRGSVVMRAVIDIEEDKQGRTTLVATQLPYMVNPDRLAQNIAELVNAGKLQGITDLRDDSSGSTGQRLVVTLRRDAQPRVVLNNLYKHTALQQSFGCNMLALVDDVPRTLSLDAFVSHWVRAPDRRHPAPYPVHAARGGARGPPVPRPGEGARHDRRGHRAHPREPDPGRRADRPDGPPRDRHRAGRVHPGHAAAPARGHGAAAHPGPSGRARDRDRGLHGDPREPRAAASDRLGRTAGDHRPVRRRPPDDDHPCRRRHVHGGPDPRRRRRGDDLARRLRQAHAADLFRSQRRGGKGVRGATLREDDVIDQMFVTTNHHWILVFTNAGRVYRTKVWELPEAARDARGQHVAGLLSFAPDEKIAQVLTLRDYQQSPYLVLATKKGLVKKTLLADYDSARSSGLIAVNFREEGDELIGAALVSDRDDLLLVSKRAQAIRFRADNEQLRPMGRATSGVTGMKFRRDDELLSMAVVPADDELEEVVDAAAGAGESVEAGETAELYVFTITDGGYAKRTNVREYRLQGRGGLGIKAMKVADDRGALVGALVVSESDEVLCIKASGQVTRSPVADVPAKGRDTMGVIFAGVRGSDTVVAVARNAEVAADVAIGSEPVTDDGAEGGAGAEAGAVADVGADSTGTETPVETGGTTDQQEDSP